MASTSLRSSVVFILFTFNTALAQHDHDIAALKKLEVKPLFQQAFTDSIFNGNAVRVAFLTVPAGAIDTVRHAHDCHLIGYVLEGRVVTKLKNKGPQYLNSGDIFYESPNEVHESLQNLNSNKDAKILLYYLFKDGAVLYKRLQD